MACLQSRVTRTLNDLSAPRARGRMGTLPASTLLAGTLLAASAFLASPAEARDLSATPETLGGMLGGLMPGDTLSLASGTYQHFSLSSIAGTAESPVVIEGPIDGSALVEADRGPCCNTIEIRSEVSHVVLRNLTVDGLGIEGAFGLSASGDNVHHVTVENCTFRNHDASQQTVAISTKTPTSGWVIRGNRVFGAGTGMYLGNSDGTDPFVGGLIENNVFYDTIGYNFQIKWQQVHEAVPGSESSPANTVIRHNVFIKTDRPSPDGDRPNLLVGGFPESGADSDDYYEIYGNLFVHNPREAHVQASGRVSIHDNIFVDAAGTSVVVTNHDLPLRRAWIYNNTFYSVGTGVSVGAASEGTAVVGNLIFADRPINGSPGVMVDNLTDTVERASAYVATPSTSLGEMDFYPLPGAASGTPIDLAAFSTDTDSDLDFNCSSKAERTFRGAYAGEGANPGWVLAMENKPAGSECSMGPGPSGSDGGGSSDAGPLPDGSIAGADAGAGDGGLSADAGVASSGGCSLGVAGTSPSPLAMALLGAFVIVRRRFMAADRS